MDLLLKFVRRHASTLLLLGALGSMPISLAPALEVAGATAPASSNPDLGLGIPSDCFFSMSCTGSSGRDVLDAHLTEIMSSLRDDGVFDGLLRNVLSPEFGDSAGLEDELAAWRRLLGDADWRGLLGLEFAIGMRYEFPTIELLALFRVAPDNRATIAGQLKRLLYGVAALGEEDLEIHSNTQNGVETLVVQSMTNRHAQVCLGGRTDLIGISTSSKILRRSLGLLEGRSSDWGLALAPQYEETFAALSRPADSFRLFLRPSVYFDQLRELSQVLAGMGGLSEDQHRIQNQLTTVLETVDIVDVVAVSGRAQGQRLNADFRIRLTEGARVSRIYGAFGEQPPLQKLGTELAEDATSFVAWNGLDFATVLRSLVSLESVGYLPLGDGDQTLSNMRDTHVGLAAFLDLLETIDGRVLLLSRQGSTGSLPTPTLRAIVGDPDAAREALARFIGWLKSEGSLAVSDSVVAEGKNTNFVVSAAGVELFVVGVFDRELCLGPSLDAVKSSLAGRKGDAKVRSLARLEESGIDLHPSQQLAGFVESASVRPWLQMFALLQSARSSGDSSSAATGHPLFELWLRMLDVVKTESIGVHRVGDSYHGQWSLELQGRDR